MLRVMLVVALGLAMAGAQARAERRPEMAAARHITTSDGVKLYVTVKGKGTPCLYIHGGPGSGSYWLEKFSGPMLEQNFRMIYLDQRGTARSTSPKSGDYSMERMVKDFEEVRKALGIERWVTLGHSFGGVLQVGYAQRHPRAVQGMLMFNTSLSLLETSGSSWVPKACELLGLSDTKPYTDASVPVMARLGPLMKALQEKDLMWKMGYASKQKKLAMDATFAEVPDWNHDQENAILSFPEYQDDYRPATRALGMPVLFFYGKTDWMAGPESYQGVHFPKMLLWGCDVGHVPFLESPDDLRKAVEAYRRAFGM